MRFNSALVFFLVIFFSSSISHAEGGIYKAWAEDLKMDYSGFYSQKTLIEAGAGVLGAGLLANTSADREFQEYYGDNLRSGSMDDLSKLARLPGEPLITLPLLAGAYAFLDGPEKVWAARSLRALFTAGPAALALQYATGGGRPEETDSKWRPFANNNGLSGHAFIGAVPFLTAAQMQESPYLKCLLYGLSALPGLSRINDEKHYLSQAALGWYLAYLGTRTVERNNEKVSFQVLPFKDGLSVSIEKRF